MVSGPPASLYQALDMSHVLLLPAVRCQQLFSDATEGLRKQTDIDTWTNLPPPTSSQGRLPGLIRAQVDPGVSRVQEDLLKRSVLLIRVTVSLWQTLM